MKPKQPRSLSHQSSWEQHIHDLKVFKRIHGHCKVPRRYTPNLSLGYWVLQMRQRKKKGILDKSKYLILKALGFVWGNLKKRG